MTPPAPSHPDPAEPGRSRRRRRLVPALVGAVVLVVIAGGVVALTTSSGSGHTAGAATVPTLARWTFAEGSGSRLDDVSDGGHDGAISDATWAAGDPGRYSLAFDGTGSSVAVDTASDLDVTTSLGIDVWVDLASGLRNGQTILTKSGSPVSYALEIMPTGRIGLYWDGTWLLSRPLPWSNGAWYHLDVVNDGSTTVFSRNGSASGEATTPGPTSTGSGQLVIGNAPATPTTALLGRIGYLALSVPGSRGAPKIAGTTLSGSTVDVGDALTVDSTIDGSWGNPDDPAEIDVSGTVTTPSGTVQTVPGFFFQDFSPDTTTRTLIPSGTPHWQVRYTPQTPGAYTVAISARTAEGSTTDRRYRFTVSAATTGYRGDVEVDPANHNYYAYESSKRSFYGIGADLDFPEFTKFNCLNGTCLPPASPMRGLFGDGVDKPDAPDTASNLYAVYSSYLTAVADLSANGANSGRLRVDSRFLPLELSPTFTGIPGYPDGVPDFTVGRYNDANAWIVDQVLAMAERDGMALQLTTWNADQLSWGDSYATDHDATLVQRRLRYEVARWGYSPAVLSWELFNELPAKSANSMTTSFWQSQIDYLRSIDTNHHVVTDSYPDVDTSEQHFYTARTVSLAPHLSKFLPGALPHTTSEYGQDAFYDLPPGYDPQGVKAREGLWASLMGQRSGAWYWWLDEQIAPDHLYATVFHGISAFTDGEDLGGSTWSRAKFTPVAGPGGLHYYGMVANDGQALIWIERSTGADLVDLPASNDNVSKVGGMLPDHSYTVQWWNTLTGTVQQTSSTTSSAGGKVTLDVPAGVTRDIAAKILT